MGPPLDHGGVIVASARHRDESRIAVAPALRSPLVTSLRKPSMWPMPASLRETWWRRQRGVPPADQLRRLLDTTHRRITVTTADGDPGSGHLPRRRS